MPSGTVGASHRKPLWAWLTMYYDLGRALGIKPWLELITPMPPSDPDSGCFSMAEPVVKLGIIILHSSYGVSLTHPTAARKQTKERTTSQWAG